MIYRMVKLLFIVVYELFPAVMFISVFYTPSLYHIILFVCFCSLVVLWYRDLEFLF